MYEYKVGKLYHSARTFWPETPIYQYRAGQHELVLFFNSPSKAEIWSVKTGRASFGFTVQNGVIVFLYQFLPGVPLGDAPFTIHLVPADERVIPGELETVESRDLLSVFLVDARTGVIQAMRAITFTPEFTAGLRAAIREQAAMTFDERKHHAAVDHIYAHFSTDELLRQAVSRCEGGE